MYNYFGYQKIQQVGENYLTFYRSFLMKKVKLLSLFLALTLILGCFVGCNGTKNPEDDDDAVSDEVTVTDLSVLEGKWVTPSGSVLMFDTEEKRYCYETYTGRCGTGEISLVDNEPMIFFDGFLYNFTLRDDGVLFPNQNGSSDSAESIHRFTFKKDDTAEIHTRGIYDLQGIWQNVEGEAISIDPDKMEYVACTKESMSSGTIYDNNDGKGLYLALNGGYAYICPAPDNNRFILKFSSAKPEENDGTFSGVFYRNGDFASYVDLKVAKFTETDGVVTYFDGMDTFYLGEDYTIKDDGLAYDQNGHLFKAGYEAPYYDPATDWGEGWYIVGGKG